MTGAWRTLSVALTANSAGYTRAMGSASAATAKFDAQNKKTTADAGSRWAKMGKIAAGGFVVLSVAIAGSIAQAISWESAWAGVTKTVDGTAAQMEKLEDDLLSMATRLPVTREEIAGVAEAAGQLGIQTENVAEFTEVMVGMGVATNLSSEEVATAFARIANITGLSQDDFDRLGSAVVDLGNNFATTESEITEMSLRIASAGTAIGLSEADILGVATAMSSVGIKAEAGGSAMSRVLINIATAVDAGGDKLAEFARVSGVSASEFATMWKEDAAGALTLFVEGLGDAQAEGESLFQLLDEFGMSDVRVGNMMRSLVGSTGLLESAIGTANRAFEENIALQEETDKRYATTASQLAILKNQITEVARVVGTEFLPAVQGAIALIQEFGKWAGDVGGQMAGKLGGAWKDLVAAGEDLGAALKVVWDTAKPVVEVLAALAAGAVVGTIIGLSDALAGMAGFLADNEWLVRALVAAVGALIAKAALASALTVLSNGLAAIGTFGSLAAEGVKGVVVAMGNMDAGSISRMGTTLHGALSGISTGAVLGGAAVAGFGAILYAWADDADKARKKAAELKRSIDTIVSGAEAAGESAEEFFQKNDFVDLWQEHGDVFEEYGVSLQTLSDYMNGTASESAAAREKMDEYFDSLEGGNTALFASAEAASAAANAREGSIDALDRATEATTNNMTAEEKAIALRSEHEASTKSLAERYMDLATAIDGAADSVRDYYGEVVSVIDAEMNVADGLITLTDAYKENGATLDRNTEKGRANFRANEEQRDLALEHALAVANENESMEDGIAVLTIRAEQMRNVGIAAGLSEPEINDMLETMGLTPEQITTIFEAEYGQMIVAQERFDEVAEHIRNADVTATLGIDDEESLAKMEYMEAMFGEYVQANPETHAFMDITDPVARKAALDGIMDDYIEKNPETSAFLNDLPARQKKRYLVGILDGFARKKWTASINASATGLAAANNAIWGVTNRRRTANVRARPTGLTATNNAIWGVANQRRTAVIDVISRASSSIFGGMYGRRWGGIDHMASGGVRQAMMGSGSNMVWWDEPETGGEAYIPRLGDKSRNRSILEIAAGWQGLTLTDPTKAHKMATGGVMHAIPPQAGNSGGGGNDHRSMSLEVNVVSPDAALAGKKVVEAIDRSYPDFAKVVNKHERAHQ